MFNLIGGVFCLVFLAMSWFLSTKAEKPQKDRLLTISSQYAKELSVINYQQSVKNESIEHKEKKQLPKEKRRRLRKPSNQLSKIDKKSSLIFGIPVEREKTWQLKERKVVLGPQALVKINIGEEPIPLRGGLGISAPREIKKYEVAPPDCLLKKE
jgi:hypothetical protein